jgi:hypothetical protein
MARADTGIVCSLPLASLLVLGLSLLLSVRPSVCYQVFCLYVQQDGQKPLPMGSPSGFSKKAVFESYGVKPK